MTGTCKKLLVQTRYDLAPVPNRAPEELEVSAESPGDPVESGKFDQKYVRSIFWIETVLAAVAASLTVVTGLCPDWIERVLPIDLDLHSGSIERNMVLACAASAALCAARARRNWRKWLTA
ncbi:MAG TPA: hypothetical protein VN777_13075 [Terriglobales bacterium]|nr:hypothetical protein [Terriglobales bacterium]